jgi:hypothetical protein
MLKKTIWASFQRIIEFFVTNLSKIWVWDPDPEKIYPGSESKGKKGTGSATLLLSVIFLGPLH